MTNFIQVDTSKCKRDGMCVEVCPIGSIEADGDGVPKQAKDAQCIECGHCVAVCPHGALTNGKLKIDRFQPVLKKLPTIGAVSGLMLSRRSVRAYKNRPVDAQVLSGLLDTARHAPTAVNYQKVSWIACVDPVKAKAVAGETIEWLRGSGIYPKMVEAWDQGREVVLRGAPAFVVAYSPVEYNWGVEDCTIALTYLELAVASAGLGACWAGLLTRAAQNHSPLAAMLGIPEGHVVRGGLMLGYPKYRYRLVPPRNEAKVHWM
jgi:nitroreductase/NAD-dependent dihydropyrimidine dehydrogenase PreA subunit